MLMKRLVLTLAFATVSIADAIPRTKPVGGVCPEGYTEKPNNQCCKHNQAPPPNRGKECKVRLLKPCPRGYKSTSNNGKNYCCKGSIPRPFRSNKCIPCPEENCPSGWQGVRLGRVSICCTKGKTQPMPTEECVPKPAGACPANYFACPAEFSGDCCPVGSLCGTTQGNIVCFA